MTYQPARDSDVDKNGPYKSSRRSARSNELRRPRRDRRILVRGDLREQPDVRKLARAIISMAMAEAERTMKPDTDASLPAEPADE